MSLLHAAAEVDQWQIHAAVVDHGLRPESAEEARGVLEAASTLQVPATCLKAPPDLMAGDGGIEAVARRARYHLLAAHQHEVGADVIFTAHTAEDQVETLLMRWASGAASRGLRGILARRGSVARPWLSVTRAAVAEYAASRGITWFEDPSNQSDRFARNRVRRALPSLSEALGPRWTLGMSRSVARLAEEQSALEWFARAWVKESCRDSRIGGICLPGAELQILPGSVRRVVLEQALRMAADGQPLPRALGAVLDGVEALTSSDGGVQIVGPVQVEWASAGLFLSVVTPMSAPEAIEIAGPGQWGWGPGHVEILRGPALGVEGELRWPGSGGLSLRGVEPGERYTPAGRPGGKRVVRLWQAAQVPPSARRWWPVLSQADEGLVWAAGLPVAADRVPERGEDCLRILWRPTDGDG